MITNDKQAWKKLAVRRDRAHEPLVDKLCTSKNGNSPLFRFNKDLMVFAAMVGFSRKKRKKLATDSISIILETYASDQKDAFIYLLALITEKNGFCLKDENLPSSITIFEEYCNAGLDEIQLWFDENPGDHGGVETLAEKIYEQVIANESKFNPVDNPDDLEVDL